jgi:hypothetical protein
MAKTQLYRYEPADNKTPVHHKTIGHLEWGQVVDHPDCEGNPDFVAIVDEDATAPAEDTSPAADSGETKPPAKPAETAKSGRSK